MGQIQDSQLPFNDSATNGNVVDQTAWNQAFQLIKTAVNDNFYRRLASVTTLNADGTVDLTATLQAASNITNALQVQMGNGITITPTASNGTITLQFSVPSKGITASQLADLTITAQQIANQTITSTQIANKTITNGQIADGTIGSTQIANAGVTLTNLDTSTVDTRYYTKSQVDTTTNNLQSQINTDNTNISTNATNLTNHINSTTAHPAANITETRMGNAQSALNDLNSRLASAITSGSVSEVGDAHNSIPLSTSYATLKARLDSMDLAGIALAQKMLNSGVIDYNGITNVITSSSSSVRGQIEAPSSTQFQYWSNAVAISNSSLLVNGAKLEISAPIASNGWTQIQLDAPPTSNVSPSLAGSARDDLVFLEAWRDATTSEWQWRIRVVDGVDFGTYPEGLDNHTGGTNPLATAQGGTNAPVANRGFAWMGYSSFASISTYSKYYGDTGLYVAYSSSNDINTYDGYAFAIPLFRVRRRNSTAFDPDTNPLGGKQYVSQMYTAPALTAYQTGVQLTCPDTSKLEVGQILNIVNTPYYKITAINSATTLTVNYLQSATFAGGQQAMNSASDRPDGLYSNIIDASDIIDLRHQVSPTGFNYQALLEKNLDLLLRGQLTTNQTVRYSRDYIGLNTANYTDDANTLLYLKFDGSINGTANGAAVNGTTGSGTVSYVNGIQGTAMKGGQVTYTLGSAVSTFTLESFFIGGSGGRFLTPLRADNSATLLKVTYSSNGQLSAQLLNSSGGSVVSVSTPSVSSSTLNTDKHYAKVTVDSTNLTITAQVDENTASAAIPSGSYLTMGSIMVAQDYSSYNAIDLVRVSNIVRSSTPLPSNFSYANGDRILDGPDGDFNFWSDDVGGTTGTGGRTNPYGLTHVPNSIAARVSYNGSEIRHYYGQGVTAGWSAYQASATDPTGSFDTNAESISVQSNESADGTRTTFTFNKPSSAVGTWVVDHNVSPAGGRVLAPGYVAPTSNGTTFNTGTGVISVTLSSAPSSGTNVYLTFLTAQRHAHFVPSTKGFIIHDWTDETHTGDGTTTAFTTTKYKVTSVNHVRVNGVIQNGGYTVGTLNQSGAGTTITFTTAPANGATIDIVYESVITPALGDYVRVMYQHVPYQGLLGTPFEGSGGYNSFFVPTNKGFITTGGTGTSGVWGSEWLKDYPAVSVQLPINVSDSLLKKDNISLSGLTLTGTSGWFMENEQLYDTGTSTSLNPFSPNLNITPATAGIRGFTNVRPGDQVHYSQVFALSMRDSTTSVPHISCIPALFLDNKSGEMYLVIFSQYRTDARNLVQVDTSSGSAMDIYKLQGRPLCRAYGGVTA